MSVFLLVQAGTYIRNGPRLALIDLRRVGGGGWVNETLGHTCMCPEVR